MIKKKMYEWMAFDGIDGILISPMFTMGSNGKYITIIRGSTSPGNEDVKLMKRSAETAEQL